MKVCGISDIHGVLIDPTTFEKVDMIALSGDFSPLHIQRDIYEMYNWLRSEFIPWVERVLYHTEAKYFVMCAGNHDFVCEEYDFRPNFLKDICIQGLEGRLIYLENELITIEGKDIYGCPYSDIPRWAFSITNNIRGYELPDDCDLLIVHQAPRYEKLGVSIFREYSDPNTWIEREFGSEYLLSKILEKKPKVVLCGHIHSGNHNRVCNGTTTFYNASIMDEDYKPTFHPQYFEI